MNTKAISILIVILIAAGLGIWWFSQDKTETPPANNGDNESEQEFITNTATVDSIDIAVLESFPVQVRVTVNGNLPDGCTGIDQTNIERNENTFNVSITTKRPKDAICTQALVPFEESISLPAEGLAKGTYTVNVNGVTDTFTLQVDNTLQDKG